MHYEPTEKSLRSVHIDFFSNQRHCSLDPVMTNNDMTDEQIPLTGVLTQHRCYTLTIRDLIADYLVGWLTGVQQEFVSGTRQQQGGALKEEISLPVTGRMHI